MATTSFIDRLPTSTDSFIKLFKVLDFNFSSTRLLTRNFVQICSGIDHLLTNAEYGWG